MSEEVTRPHGAEDISYQSFWCNVCRAWFTREFLEQYWHEHFTLDYKIPEKSWLRTYTKEIKPKTKQKEKTEQILLEREDNYGAYSRVSRVAQNIKEDMKIGASWQQLYPEQRESLEMIANKIARIVNGNIIYRDSWEDIKGYAELALRSMPNEQS